MTLFIRLENNILTSLEWPQIQSPLVISKSKAAFDIQVNGKRGPRRPKMTWKQLTERDRREWKLSAIDPHDRDTWRSGVRSAMRAASQLPGKGPTVVDMAPIPAH